MKMENARYYAQKLVVNSRFGKAICASFVAFFWIITEDHVIVFDILLRLRVFSMIFWTANWIIKYGFNMRKFLLWGVKIITYGMMIYFAQSLDIITSVDIRVEIFSTFMIYELLLSIIKHCSEIWIPMPNKLVDFIFRQEKAFEDKFLNDKKIKIEKIK